MALWPFGRKSKKTGNGISAVPPAATSNSNSRAAASFGTRDHGRVNGAGNGQGDRPQTPRSARSARSARSRREPRPRASAQSLKSAYRDGAGRPTSSTRATSHARQPSSHRAGTKLSSSTGPGPSPRDDKTTRVRSATNDKSQRPRSTSRKLSKSQTAGSRRKQEAEEAAGASSAVPPVPKLPRDRKHEVRDMTRSPDTQSTPRHGHDGMNSTTVRVSDSTSSMRPSKDGQYLEVPSKRSSLMNDNSLLARKLSSGSRYKRKARKAEDRAREEEIRKLSSPIPIPKGSGPRRPKSYQHDLQLQNTQTRNVAHDLERHLQRPVSNVSLPTAGSFHSQMAASLDANSPKHPQAQHAFKISALDALSPRPTIRHLGRDSRPIPGASLRHPWPHDQPTAIESKEPVILEELHDQHSRRRIEGLADDLDAGGLRELMERERRRTERHRRADMDKLQQRLERKAAKDASNDEAGLGLVDDIVVRHESTRGRKMQPRPQTPLDLITSRRQAAGTSRDEGVRTPESWLKDPSREHLPLHSSPTYRPGTGFASSHLEEPSPVDDAGDEPVIETAKAVRLSSASMSPPLSPTLHTHTQTPTPRLSQDTGLVAEASNLSQYPSVAMSATPEIPEEPSTFTSSQEPSTEARPQQSPGRRLSSTWKSIFRRSDLRGRPAPRPVLASSSDRDRLTPSEFSNTSRDSFGRQLTPARLSDPRLSRVRSGTPIRAQSIFREDLPDSVPSRPVSSMRSPDDTSDRLTPSNNFQQGLRIDTSSTPMHKPMQAGTQESHSHAGSALSRNTSLRTNTPDPAQSMSLSVSLASVDAEGSWLAQKPVVKSPTVPPDRRDSDLNIERSARQSQTIATRPTDHLGHTLENEDQNTNSEDEDANIYDGQGTPPAQRYMGSLTPMAHSQINDDPMPRTASLRLPKSSGPMTSTSQEDSVPIKQSSMQTMPTSLPRTQLPAQAQRAYMPSILASSTEEDGTNTTWHSSVGRHPTIVREGLGHRAASREGLLNEFHDAEGSVAIIETNSSHHRASSLNPGLGVDQSLSARQKSRRRHASPMNAGIGPDNGLGSSPTIPYTDPDAAPMRDQSAAESRRSRQHSRDLDLTANEETFHLAPLTQDQDHVTHEERTGIGGASENDREKPVISRATSIDLSTRRARHVSAGSARLLDISSRRTSLESKRFSTSSTLSAHNQASSTTSEQH